MIIIIQLSRLLFINKKYNEALEIMEQEPNMENIFELFVPFLCLKGIYFLKIFLFIFFLKV